ncbi:MAG TPA: acetyl-CoA carboxylase biotin carboxylase subunit [Anaerolineales bacterium]|nr:acetyl-CoA carboxylase biotin carboxylase subunit [Anaerolineales bacterium]
MFKKVLIANRGEIAVRIIRACQELGLETVAVYSEADRNAPHVRFANEAYLIGPAPARESYLRSEKLIEIALKSQAEAIHPGYGFLSERAEFAEACANAGLIFIGPSSQAIRQMGDKVTARKTVAAAGVPLVPGTDSARDLNDEELIAAGMQIGFPLLVKAAAGGGGKGMRMVHQPQDLAQSIASARAEAESAFGDGRVYLEKLITGGRHIEIQVLGDQHGNIIHLGERECSIQRRHQKLLEESPSPFVGDDEELRQRMGAVACAAAAAVNYVSAGTIEFLVDNDKNFYFLEMNTRLQVEHPVTELVTGVDIVKEQIRVARGRKLRLTQADVKMSGWAIECRINAEDPYNNFLPSIGRIETSILPGGPGVRVDTCAFPGYQVTPYYDSMIAKLICYGENRPETLMRLRRALNEYRIIGVKTTIPFHQQLLNSHRFMAGKFHTRFVDEEFSMDRNADEHEERIAVIMAALAAYQHLQQSAHIVQRNKRDTSNWKWVGRWERQHR